MTRQQELRVALVARDMAQGGSWLIPKFQRQVRLKKPPLSYWTAAVSTTLIAPPVAKSQTSEPGPLASEPVPLASPSSLPSSRASTFAARLPTACFGFLLALGIFFMGRMLFPNTLVGFIGALVACTTLCFIRHARLAETDIPMSAFIVLSLIFSYRLCQRRMLRDGLLAGLFAGLGFMTKGLAALAIPLAVPLLFAAWKNLPLNGGKKEAPATQWQNPGTRLRGLFSSMLGVLVFVLVAAPWYLYIMQVQAGSEAVSSELNAALGQTKHPGNPAYYVYTLLVQLLPWGLLLPVAIWRLKRLAPSAGKRFLILWAVFAFGLLSAIPSKQSHYTVLLIAPFSLILGTWLAAWWADRKRSHSLIRLIAVPAVIAIGCGLWMGFGQPRFGERERIPPFLNPNDPAFVTAPRIHAVGMNSAIFEFYLQRVVDNVDDLNIAWQRAAAGDAVVYIGKDLLEDPGPVTRGFDGMKYHGRLYRK